MSDPEVREDQGTRLMLALQAGDESAFQGLVHLYQTRVFNLLFRSVGRRDIAEDLCQEVFLRVFRARATYQPRARFSTWLYRISHNLAINHAEYRRRRKAISMDGTGDPDGPAREMVDPSAPQPSAVLERGELRERVRAAVASLSPNQRMATIYSKYQEMSYEEIGRVMGLKVEAVKSLLFRARENLRVKLQPYLSEEVCRELQ